MMLKPNMRPSEIRAIIQDLSAEDLVTFRTTISMRLQELLEACVIKRRLVAVPDGQDFIQTLKVVRESTGLGLREARDVTDAVRHGTPYDLSLWQPSQLAWLMGIPGVKVEEG